MDIIFHLREFLQSHKTVGIDGLGTFYKKKSPGKYDVDTHSFLPPSYVLAFGSEVNEPEKFVTFMVETTNVSQESAKLQMNEFVQKIHAQLNAQQEFVLADFGKFTLVNDQIAFTPSESNDFGNEFFGLPSLPEIKEPTPQTENLAEVEPAPIEEKEVESPAPEIEVKYTSSTNDLKFTGKPFTPNYDYDDDSDGEMSRPVKILLRILLVFAIIAAIVGLAYFFKPDYFDRFVNSDDVESVPTELAIPIDSANQVNEQINPDTAITARPDTTVVAKPQPKITESDITTYEVIGSAEKNQKRIDLVINTMKKRGIEARALEGVPGKLVKISLGSFTDFNLAKKYQDSLRKKLNNSEIYIQTIKPKK
jgi:nucleoid DNA-binding protein